MVAPTRKPIATLSWQIWAILAVVLALVLLIAVGLTF